MISIPTKIKWVMVKIVRDLFVTEHTTLAMHIVVSTHQVAISLERSSMTNWEYLASFLALDLHFELEVQDLVDRCPT